MNVLGAMSKLQQWAAIPPEATQTIQVVTRLHAEAKKQVVKPEESHDDNNNKSSSPAKEPGAVMDSEALKRAFFFRGYAQFKLGTFAPAELDFRKAMELSPGDNSFREEWNELQAAIQCEKRGMELYRCVMMMTMCVEPILPSMTSQ